MQGLCLPTACCKTLGVAIIQLRNCSFADAMVPYATFGCYLGPHKFIDSLAIQFMIFLMLSPWFIANLKDSLNRVDTSESKLTSIPQEPVVLFNHSNL